MELSNAVRENIFPVCKSWSVVGEVAEDRLRLAMPLREERGGGEGGTTTVVREVYLSPTGVVLVSCVSFGGDGCQGLFARSDSRVVRCPPCQMTHQSALRAKRRKSQDLTPTAAATASFAPLAAAGAEARASATATTPGLAPLPSASATATTPGLAPPSASATATTPGLTPPSASATATTPGLAPLPSASDTATTPGLAPPSASATATTPGLAPPPTAVSVQQEL